MTIGTDSEAQGPFAGYQARTTTDTNSRFRCAALVTTAARNQKVSEISNHSQQVSPSPSSVLSNLALLLRQIKNETTLLLWLAGAHLGPN